MLVAVYMRDEYAEKHKSGPGCGFLAAWVAATVVGSTIGSILAWQILAWKPDGLWELLDTEALGGLCLGMFVGLAQAGILLPYLKGNGAFHWVLATAFGRVMQVSLLSVLSSSLLSIFPEANNIFDLGALCKLIFILAPIAAFAGAATGYVQRIVLERRVIYAHMWMWVNVGISIYLSIFANPSYALAKLLFESYGAFSDKLLTGIVIVILTAVIPALITGYVLRDLLRHPTTQAEWAVRLRDDPTRPYIDTEVQLSPEVMLEREQGKSV